MPLTSIIITTHNRPQLLTRAVESARAAGTKIEVIVVDDASSDETAAVCATLPGIKYLRLERNQRVAGARNVGLLASSGEYVSFLDDDDLRLPNSLDQQVKLLEADERAGLVYGQAIVADQQVSPMNEIEKHAGRDACAPSIYPLECPDGDVFWHLLSQNFIPCGSAVFRRSCLDRIGLLDSELPGLDDWDLWIRIAELYPIIALAKPVMIWRRSTPVSGQGTSQAADIVSQAVRQFRHWWMKIPRAATAPARIRRAAWREFSANMAAHLVYEAFRALRLGSLHLAARNFFALSHPGILAVARLAGRRKFPGLRRRTVGQEPKTSASYSINSRAPEEGPMTIAIRK